VPFVGESSRGYESVDVGMFKDPFIMGISILPTPDTTHVSPINMICSATSRSLRSFDPWVVSHPEDVDYEASILLITVEIFDLTIPLESIDTGQQLHPPLECDQPSLSTRVVESLSSHNFLDIVLPSEEAIPGFMASINKPGEDENHHTFLLHNLELMRVNTMSNDLRLGEFVGVSSEIPSLDPFFILVIFFRTFHIHSYVAWPRHGVPYDSNNGS
jgi:hypothetical protein